MADSQPASGATILGEVSRRPTLIKKAGNPLDGNHIGLGVVGCGGFGLFALQHFTQVPGIKLVGMAGTHRPASLAAAARFGVENVDDVGELLRREDVGLIYVATPPFLHHTQAMAALDAGKHVIVEKPLAMTVGQADELIAAARRRDRLLVANLMQRYNPLFDRSQNQCSGGRLSSEA